MKIFLIIAFLTGGFFSLLAQSAEEKVLEQTNIKALQALSQKWQKEAAIQKKIAHKKAKEKGWVLRKDYRDGNSIELIALDAEGQPLYYQTHNLSAGNSTNTTPLHTTSSLGYNLEGQGMIIGEWDAGAVLLNHQETIGRITQVDGATTTHDHAQHVSGTMIASGVDSMAKGMAPQAHLWAHDWNNDHGEMAMAATNGLLISQHSYGFITGWHFDSDDNKWYWYGNPAISPNEDYKFGYYSPAAAQLDLVAYNAPYYLICKSAGNDRGSSHSGLHLVRDQFSNWISVSSQRDNDGGNTGFDCISPKGNAKNILTVGAVDDVPNYLAPASVAMTYFSGWGPTDDGRIKPDLVGNGMRLYSSSHDSPTSYSTKSGTSMSGPNVAGSLLLIQQHYRNLHQQYLTAASLKGLAIHTCREAGNTLGPDYSYGWGLLNTLAAVQLLEQTNSTIIEPSISNNQIYQKKFYHNGQQPIRATICWTDVVGLSPNASLNNTQSILVNDLDIRIIDPQGNIYYPYVLDPANPTAAATHGDNFRDNVEQIFQQNTTQGYYTLQVSHKGTLSNPQKFSLILEGIDHLPPVCLNLDSIWTESQTTTLAKGQHITTDSLGNFYVAGTFNGRLQLGAFSLNSNGNEEIFVAKYDAQKNPLWLGKMTGNNRNEISKIVCDENLNLYLTGNFLNNLDIQGTLFSNNHASLHGFVSKFDPNGNLLWANEILSLGENKTTGLALLGNDICLSGFFDGYLIINNQTINNRGAFNDSYLIRFDANGNLIWGKSFGGADDDAFLALATDENNHIWAGGYFNGSADYDNFNLLGSNQNAVLVELSANGTVLSNKEILGDSSEAIVQLLTDKSNHIYAACSYQNNISIAQQVSQSHQGKDMAIISYELSGSYQWQKHLHTNQNIRLGQMAYLDHQLYLPIQYSDSLWVADSIYNPIATEAGLLLLEDLGFFHRFISFGSSADDAATAVATNDRHIYSTGYAKGNFSLNGQNITADNTADMWVAIWQYEALPQINLGLDKIVACLDTVYLNATVEGSNNFRWTPSLGLSDSSSLQPYFVIQQNSIYKVQASNDCGQQSFDNIIVQIDPNRGMQLQLPADTTINCGDSLLINPIAIGQGQPTYRWQPAHGINHRDSLSVKISPQAPNLNYRLTMTNSCGYQISDNMRIITLAPTLSATISNDTTINCGDSILIKVAASGYPSIHYNWLPNTALSSPQTAQTMASPKQNTTYLVQVLADCNSFTTRTVRINVQALNISIQSRANVLFYAGAANSYQWYKDGQLIVGATDSVLIVQDTADYHLEIVDTNACSAISSPIYYNPLSTVYFTPNQNIILYPNPNRGNFIIVLKGITTSKVQIFNAQGQEVYQTISTNSLINVNLPNLVPSTYWVKVISNDNVYILPFVKQ